MADRLFHRQQFPAATLVLRPARRAAVIEDLQANFVGEVGIDPRREGHLASRGPTGARIIRHRSDNLAVRPGSRRRDNELRAVLAVFGHLEIGIILTDDAGRDAACRPVGDDIAARVLNEVPCRFRGDRVLLKHIGRSLADRGRDGKGLRAAVAKNRVVVDDLR